MHAGKLFDENFVQASASSFYSTVEQQVRNNHFSHVALSACLSSANFLPNRRRHRSV